MQPWIHDTITLPPIKPVMANTPKVTEKEILFYELKLQTNNTWVSVLSEGWLRTQLWKMLTQTTNSPNIWWLMTYKHQSGLVRTIVPLQNENENRISFTYYLRYRRTTVSFFTHKVVECTAIRFYITSWKPAVSKSTDLICLGKTSWPSLHCC